jgi:hypothetical protein
MTHKTVTPPTNHPTLCVTTVQSQLLVQAVIKTFNMEKIIFLFFFYIFAKRGDILKYDKVLLNIPSLSNVAKIMSYYGRQAVCVSL